MKTRHEQIRICEQQSGCVKPHLGNPWLEVVNQRTDAADQSNAAVSEQSTRSTAIASPPLQAHIGGMQNGCSAATLLLHEESPYMTTAEAAAYLRKSISWILRVPDLPYLRGKPNLYARADLDTWIEKHKFRPRLKF